jgi:Skp family chaperone for outer membrane proteins
MLPRPPHKHGKTLLLGFTILFCGMIIGAGLTIYFGHLMLLQAFQSSDEMAVHLTKRIAWEVDLRATQQEQVQKIVRARLDDFRSIYETVYPRIEEQFEQLHQEVKKILDDKQQEKWEAHYRKMRAAFNRHRPALFPPPQP